MIRVISGLEPTPLLEVSIWGFIPHTSASDGVARKTDLRDRIGLEIRDLPSVRNSCRGKRLSLDVCFRLWGATAESGRKTKDLDNMLKILLDTLPAYMDREKTRPGLGLVPEDRDDLVFHIDCRKRLVADKSLEGIDLKISEFVEEQGRTAAEPQ